MLATLRGVAIDLRETGHWANCLPFYPGITYVLISVSYLDNSNIKIWPQTRVSKWVYSLAHSFFPYEAPMHIHMYKNMYTYMHTRIHARTCVCTHTHSHFGFCLENYFISKQNFMTHSQGQGGALLTSLFWSCPCCLVWVHVHSTSLS